MTDKSKAALIIAVMLAVILALIWKTKNYVSCVMSHPGTSSDWVNVIYYDQYLKQKHIIGNSIFFNWELHTSLLTQNKFMTKYQAAYIIRFMVRMRADFNTGFLDSGGVYYG